MQVSDAAIRISTGDIDPEHLRGAQIILGDEMHEWETRDLEDNLRQGTGTR